ncbi:hypothetical protein GQ54DRAFT_315046 [Martensiomyces pterosporus]|nr:hypothetical protein GQ54DRAFT_315046 [Martensiomyces pterosporus]
MDVDRVLLKKKGGTGRRQTQQRQQRRRQQQQRNNTPQESSFRSNRLRYEDFSGYWFFMARLTKNDELAIVNHLHNGLSTREVAKVRKKLDDVMGIRVCNVTTIGRGSYGLMKLKSTALGQMDVVTGGNTQKNIFNQSMLCKL